MDNKFVLEKLNNENYFLWKFKMEYLLRKEGCWFATSTVKQAEKAKDTADATSSKSTDPEKLSTWEVADEKARSLIVLCVSDNQLSLLRNKETANEMWTSLENFHQKSTLVNKITLLRNLWAMKLEDHGDPRTHFEQMENYVQKIIDLGEKNLTESLKVAILLNSLPSSCNTLITALEARDDTELTISLVQTKVLDEFSRRKPDQSSTEKLFKVAKKLNKQNKHCVFCKRTNHNVDECFRLKNKKQKEEKKDPTTKISNINETKASTSDEMLFGIQEQYVSSNWILDSGATSHITNDKSLFCLLDESYKNTVNVANGNSVKIRGIGECKVKLVNEHGGITNARFLNVLYAPDLNGSYLSIKKLSEKGYVVNFLNEKAKISFLDKQIAVATISNNLFQLNNQEDSVNTLIANKKCIHFWHRVFGHRDINLIQSMFKNKLIADLPIDKCECNSTCDVCLMGKMTRKRFSSDRPKQSKQVLDAIHTDLCGPMPVQTHSGKRYMLTFIDDHSRYTEVYLLREKSEVTDKIKEYVALALNTKHQKPKRFCCDNGGEYVNSELSNYLKTEGIQIETTPPYTPQLNGIAERKNRSLVEMARCMLLDANLPKTFWGEAINTANYVQNRLITRATNKIPASVWDNQSPLYKHLHIFGALCYVKTPNEQRKKLDNTSSQMLLLGYKNNHVYRCYDIQSNRIVHSRDVKFVAQSDQVEFTSAQDNANESPITEPNNQDHSEQQPRRSPRINKGTPPDRLGYDNVQSRYMNWYPPTQCVNSIHEPRTYKEAIASSDSDKWLVAMKDELSSMHSNNTWKLIKAPPNTNIVGSRWLYKVKLNQFNQVDRFKARLVAQGYSQKYGVDYDLVFAPVVKQTTFRVLLAIASKYKLPVRHLDVKTAFLYGLLKEDIYMRQPPGFEEKGREDYVCKLERSIYGLKQAPRMWNESINQALTAIGFKRSKADHCLYFKSLGNDWCLLLIYVDDIILTATSDELIETVKTDISNCFEIRDLGIVNFYLGLHIQCDKNGIYNANQTLYINKICAEFGLSDANPSKNPIDPGYYSAGDETNQLINNNQYQSLIGCLLYVTLNTRPDISSAICILSQKTSCPTQRDWDELKRVVKYLKGTSELKLYMHSDDSNQQLYGYADSSYAEDRIDRKSMSGYLFKFFGALISWSTRKQQCVTVSSTEAEYVALTEATKEGLWLKKLLKDFNQHIKYPILMYQDNTSCIKMLTSDKVNNRTKHIDVRYHFVKNLVKEKQFNVIHCPSTEMLADPLTKPNTTVKLLNFIHCVNLKN